MAVKKKKTTKKRRAGLKANGQLEKGHRWGKGGKIIKVKSKPKSKAKKSSSKKKKGTSPIYYAGKEAVGEYSYRLKSRR